jgi:hypothetical protein
MMASQDLKEYVNHLRFIDRILEHLPKDEQLVVQKTLLDKLLVRNGEWALEFLTFDDAFDSVGDAYADIEERVETLQ